MGARGDIHSAPRASLNMSAVWRYFSISGTDKKLAICNDCKAQVMRGVEKQHSFNTTNLIVHLKSRHPELHREFLKSKEEKAPAPAKTSMQPLLRSFNKAKAFNSDHPKVKEINKKIIEFIALDNQPFSVVEDAGFRRLMMHLEPRYAMPSRRFFSDVALPELQCSVSNHVEKLLANAAHISFTSDIWTSSVSPVSMLSLTAQWIDEDFTLKKAVLHSQECSGSHTAASIASAFDSMFKKWNISKEMVHVVLRDNARNMAKAMLEFGVPSLPCMVHTLQLAVHEGVLAQRSVADVVAVGRKIVGHFKHSQVASSRLQGVQKELGMQVKRLQQDVATRWNSTFYMMQSLVEQKRALGAYAADYELPATVTANQWAILENMITLLAPFEQLTREISSAEASAADVIPAVVALRRLLSRPTDTDRGVQTAKATLLKAVNDRFHGVQSEPLFSIATMLDARYKDRYFDVDQKRSARDLLLTVLDKMDDGTGSAHTSTEAPLKRRPEQDHCWTCMKKFWRRVAHMESWQIPKQHHR
ncbi:zinc finger BED domain-containing protein 4-like [Acanthochromis polyacanthus]|uniref:zinc finger BED domain-containing protein 4-like n=1 Tax=Acanthochromis polyacanthus TaxID=80966 RepID=UPI00223404AE|nr:zinc finger BED domain-containing protein 4-like [Acanthochromis polyacanthus]